MENDGVIILTGTGSGDLVVVTVDELGEFDETEHLDLPADAIDQVEATTRTLVMLLKKAEIDQATVLTTGTDVEGQARQDDLRELTAHCWWINILSLESTGIDDDGWEGKRQWHMGQKKFFMSLVLGLNEDMEKVTDDTVTKDPGADTDPGALRIVSVSGASKVRSGGIF